MELQRRSPNNIVLPELPGEMPGGKVWPGDVSTQNQRDSSPAAQTLDDGMADERRQRAAKAEDETERTGILAGVKDEYIQLARRLGKATGRSIVFFDEAAGENGGMNNGFYNPDDGSLHVNARSGNPVAQIISHELTHSIEDSGFYDKLSRLVFDRMRREGADISALRQAKRELYEKNGVELEGYGEVDAELVAEYVEKNLLTDEAAIRAVVDYDRTLGQRILDFLNNLLGKLGSKSARERLFLSRARRYYQAALEETQESSARVGQTVAEQEGRISRIGEQLRGGELTDEQAEAIFNETYDPELDLRRNGAAEESRRRYSFAGENSRTADLDALERAKQLREADVADETILRETGWYVGADGKWRYEIDDSGMKYNASGENRGADRNRTLREYNRYFKALTEHEMTSAQRRELADYIHKADRGEFDEALYNRLAEAFGNDFENFAGALEAKRESADYSEGKTVGDYISHSALFDAYPQLRDMKLEFDALDEGERGHYSRADNAIVIDRSLRNAPEETLLHEIQHAIQDIAGFTGGASPQYWARREYESGDLVGERLQREYDRTLNGLPRDEQNKYIRYMELERELGRLFWADENSEDGRRYARLEKQQDALYEELYPNEWFKKLLDLNRRMTDTQGEYMNMYRDTAGEIEARDVSARRNLTAEERRNLMPDRGDENTVFADGDGRSYSIGNTRDMTIREQLKKYRAGRLTSHDEFYYGSAPTVLDVMGLNRHPLVMSQTDFRKSKSEKHNVPTRAMTKLAESLNDPILSFETGDKIGILTKDIDGDGKPLLVGIMKNVDLDGETVNRIKSAYGLDNPQAWIENQIKEGKELRIFDNKKADSFLDEFGYMAERPKNYRSGDIVTGIHKNVKKQFSITEEAPSGSKTTDNQGRELTEAQQEFFRDSKVRVDDDGDYWYGEGRLLPVYHATYNEFTVFDREKLGENTTDASDEFFAATAHVGFWFNTQPLNEVIKFGTRSEKVYLNIKKPYMAGTLEGLTNAIADASGIRSEEDLESLGEDAPRVMGEAFTVYLRQHGYDGVVLDDEEMGGLSFVALDPEQIKNVTNENPTSDPDIRFSITEETPSEGKTTQREDEYQAALNGFPQINGVQIVPYKTWVHATDIMSDEHGNILRDANGEARRRDNYGIVTGLDSGMPGRLLVSFRNDEYGTRASNVSIAPEDLEPVSKYEYASEKAFEDTMEQEPLDPASEQLSAEEQAEIENMRQAAEQREDAERATQEKFEPTTREALNNKARSYLERVERSLVNRVANVMSVPRFARREYLNEIAQRISDEYLAEGRVSDETANELFERAYNEGIVVDEEFYQEYKPVKDHLRTQAVTISEGDRQSIPDFNNFRRRAFGSLKIVNEGGIPADSAYQELREMAPELFPEDITHPADQLVIMLEAAQSIQKMEKSLSEYYGEDAAEFKKWARNDFDDAINSSIGELRNVRRYANDVAAKGEKAKRPTLTVQQARDAYTQLKKARWAMEKAKAKNLLTDADNIQLGRLLRGEIQPEHLDPGRDNVHGIIAVYEASREYEALVQQINDYKQSIRAQAAAKADEYLKTANRWKDKAIGLAYARETMERNIEDIVPDKKLAADIIREYITPVHDAEAAATRFKNQMRDRVRKLELGIKPTKGNEVSEAYAVQLLGEAEDNIRVLRESRGRLERRDGKTAEEWAAEIAELKEHNPSMDWGKIENAVDEFRKIYDELIDRLNEARVRNGYEPINYRSGYFPHFQAGEDGGALARMGRALGITTGVETLPTTINGLTSQFKPGIRWFSAAQERRGYNTVYDAVQGFERYINGAADVIFHTDNIQALRTLANQIRKRTSDEGIRAQINELEKSTELTEEQKDELKKQIYESGRYSLSNFVAELDEYTNLLAGKKSKYDRAMEAMLGRRAYTIMKNIESRVGANMIGGNFGSALTNFIPLTQAWGQIGTTDLLRGMWQTLKAIKENDGIVDASSFLTNRRGSDPIVQNWLQKASSASGMVMSTIDSFTSGSIVRARYTQNLRHGMSEAAAMSEADAFAAKVMADRSKGSMPTLFESKNPLFKAFTQFQLEVNNQFSEVFKDLPKVYRDRGLKAMAAALFKYFIGMYLFNDLYELIVGRRPALDPLGILNDTVGDFTGYELPNLFELAAGAITGDMPSFKTEKQSVGTSLQNLGTNILSELPFSSGLNLLGIDVDGGRLPVASAIPDVANILTAATKSGVSGKKRVKTILDELMKPAAYLLPPFGGNQAQKIWKSVYALSQGGSYTMDNEGNAKLQYPIYSDDKGSYVLDFSRMLLFGKSSLKEAREWAENNYNTLSAKQTAAYQDMVDNGENQRKAYDVVDELRQAEKTDEQTKKYVQCEILRGADISGESRAIAYRTLLASDKEAELMDSFDAGTDLGQITNVLIDMYEAKKTDGKLAVLADAGLTKDETISFLAYLMGDELYTENGNKTQFAKMQLCLDMGMSVKEVIGAKLNGESFDKILKEFGATENSDSGWASPWGNSGEDGWASPWGKQDENGWASPWD